MNRIIDEVVDSIVKSGLVEVEVSARHVHLTQEQIEILFGEGAQLHPKRMLSQPGQFLSEEKVKLVGKKGTLQFLFNRRHQFLVCVKSRKLRIVCLDFLRTLK